MVTEYDVRPARRRDLPHLALADFEGTDLVMVAGDPPVAHVRVSMAAGHAHLVDLDGAPELFTPLVEAVGERLAARGQGQLTVAAAPEDVARYPRLGFAEIPADEPVAGHLAGIHASDGQVLMRRVLRRHRTTEELFAFLPMLDAAPKDEGTLRLLVRRPAVGVREVLDVGVLDVTVGLAGDTWIKRGSKRTEDGSSHPDMQLNVMSHPLIEFLAQDPEREALAGDQLFLDLDLSHENLPAWSELHIGGEGGAVIQVTDQPHNGCGKFISRFGKEAMAFVNGAEGKPRRLRGLCARVAQPGVVRAGDRVLVRRPPDAAGE